MLRFLFIGLFISILPLYSGGFETAGIGARQMNMGGAAIGLADDWTAIFWNPAGLAFQTGSQFGFDIRLSSMNQTADESLNNRTMGPGYNPGLGDFPIAFTGPVPDWAGAEPSQFDEDTISANQFRPDMGWYKAFDTFTFGIGLYGSGGLGADWEDTVYASNGDRIDAEYHTAVYVLNIPIAFAMQIDERQSFGTSLQILYGNNSRDISKDYRGGTLPAYAYEWQETGSGFGLELDLGYMYKISDSLTFGALYRSHYVLHSPGESETSLDAMSVDESSDLEMTMKYPGRLGAGVSWQATDTFLVAADLYYINWSAMEIRIDYEDEAVALRDRRVSTDMKNTWQLRIGCEYQYSDKLTLRAGFYSDPSPYPDSYASLVQARYPHANVLAFGAGYTKDKITYNAMLNYTIVYPSEGNSNEIDGSVYNMAFGMVIEL